MTWARALQALNVLAIDPIGMRGIVVRARAGDVRDRFQSLLGFLPQPLRKIHPSMPDDALYGGMDLSQTLSNGKLCLSPGVLSEARTALLTMSERCDGGFAARLAHSLDDQKPNVLVCYDEGADAEETLPHPLTERLGLYVTLDCAVSEICGGLETDQIEAAKLCLDDVTVPDDMTLAVVGICMRLGIHSARAPQFTLRAARCLAALRAVAEVEEQDLVAAVELTLPHRATMAPAPEEIPPPPEPEADAEPSQPNDVGTLDDRVVDAVLAQLPVGLLDQLHHRASRGTGTGSGAKRKGNRRGRPKPARSGQLNGCNRLDLIATLRAAAPWQQLRGQSADQIRIWPSDFRIKQFEETSDRLLIFTVDASGSAAIARLAEAKGAVELLLSEAYAKRDHVALVAFKGEGADILLPPTRSLVQTKKRLASLPGGGGTPLAAGLLEAMTLAERARAQGMTPSIITLTDGRANISLSGKADRGEAGADATQIGKRIHAAAIDSILLDVGNRPSRALTELARSMNAEYVALPRADAAKMSGAVTAALRD